jgi:tetratricopeptide (TPR) repeat protein
MFDPKPCKIFLIASLALALSACDLEQTETERLINRGVNRSNAGDYVGAEAAFRTVLSHEQNKYLRLSALIGLQKTLLRAGRYDQCVAASNEALRSCDTAYGSGDNLSTSILLVKAVAEKGLRQFDQAAATCARARAISRSVACPGPAYGVVYDLQSADLARMRGNNLEAARLYEALPVIASLHALVDTKTALAYEAEAEHDKAKAAYLRAIPGEGPGSPGDVSTFNRYIDFLKKRGKPKEAQVIEARKAVWMAEDQRMQDWLLKRAGQRSGKGLARLMANLEFRGIDADEEKKHQAQ